MKRLIALGIALAAVISGVYILRQTAIDPEIYTGDWYRVEDGKMYHFHDGMIQASGDQQIICGAYSFCADRIVLFVKEQTGSSRVQELYPTGEPKGEFLSEKASGSGRIVFSREKLTPQTE